MSITEVRQAIDSTSVQEAVVVTLGVLLVLCVLGKVLARK